MREPLNLPPTRRHGLYGTVNPAFLRNGMSCGVRCNHGNHLARPRRGFPCDIVDTGLLSMPRKIGSAYTTFVRMPYTAILKTPRSSCHSAFPRLASAGPIT